MASPADLIRAVEKNPSIDLPGKASSLVWRTVAPAVLALTSVAAAASSTKPVVRLVAAVLAVGLLAVTIAGLASLARVRHTYRIRPEGLSIDGSPVIGWALVGGAFRHTDPHTDRGAQELVVLSLTDDGLAWLRQHGTARMKLAHRPDLRGMQIPLVKECSPQDTAKVLSAATRAHRTRLGLPPVA